MSPSTNTFRFETRTRNRPIRRVRCLIGHPPHDPRHRAVRHVLIGSQEICSRGSVLLRRQSLVVSSPSEDLPPSALQGAALHIPLFAASLAIACHVGHDLLASGRDVVQPTIVLDVIRSRCSNTDPSICRRNHDDRLSRLIRTDSRAASTALNRRNWKEQPAMRTFARYASSFIRRE